MLHNKGNSIPHYGKNFGGNATSLAYKSIYQYYGYCIVFFNTLKIFNFYTFESKNIRNYNNICKDLPK